MSDKNGPALIIEDLKAVGLTILEWVRDFVRMIRGA